MEISIRIIITFLVIFSVGIIVLNISSELLTTNQNNLNELSENYLSNEDKIIEKNIFFQQDIEFLVSECYDRYKNIVPEENTCLILRSEKNSINLSQYKSDLEEIDYIHHVEDIETKTAFIKFNSINNISIID